jgi:hypothetical protein
MNFLDTKEMKLSMVIDYDLICKSSPRWCLPSCISTMAVIHLACHFEENKMVSVVDFHTMA